LSRYGMRHAVALLFGAVALFALYSSPALASGPPIVSIESSTEHSLNTAQINGTVDSNGYFTTTYKIEYGKTKLYGQSTATKTLSGSGAHAISEVLAGLEALSTDHARISATNGAGTTTSSDFQFEMLLGWKVEGKPLSSFPKGVAYGVYDNEPVPKVTITGTSVGLATEVVCDGRDGEVQSFLGSTYRMTAENCKVYLNGTLSECSQKSIPLTANANAVVIETVKLKTTGECPLPETIVLGNPGFALKEMAEAAEPQPVSMSATAVTTAGAKWNITISNMRWFLFGEQTGQKFGIS